MLLKNRHLLVKLLLGTLLLSSFTANARTLPDDKTYESLPAQYDGSMMPFDFTACDAPLQMPDSLTAIHGEYIARHGARYLSSRAKIDNLEKWLLDAHAAHYLSASGIEFLHYLYRIDDLSTGKWGELSPVGEIEEVKLARRVKDALPKLSHKDTRVEAISSFVPRCVMSMYEFTHELISLNDSISVATDEGEQFNKLLRCFEADPFYADFRNSGDWKPIYDDFVKRNIPTLPARRLIGNPNLSESQLRDITLMMYEVLKGNRAAGLPAPSSKWMSEDEYKACWLASNLQMYLRNSISPVSSLAASATKPLIDHIIDSADKAIKHPNNTPTLNCYFGHAETLLPLLATMHLEGCYDMPLDYDNLQKNWQVQDITPLGANLLIVFSKSKRGQIYVALQLNGKNIAPIPGEKMIVSWHELRAYWKTLSKSNLLRN